MKGVIASRCQTHIADLTHEIAPFDVWEAAFFLRDVAMYWPEGTIFVCVIDPGVGTARRILAVESEGRFFLAPDNGLLTFVEGATHAITNESFFLPRGSNTFHGRDRFAPVAAAIANGTRIEELGSRVDDRVLLDYQPGTIVRVDRFGNCVTDIIPPRTPFAVVVRGVRIGAVRTTYGGADPFAIVGSTGCIEISVASASAATLLQLSRGDRVTIVPA